MSTTYEEEIAAPNASGRTVVIIGGLSLQSRLLASLIEERIGCTCVIRSVDDTSDLPIAARALALLDVENAAAGDIASHLKLLAASTSIHSIALVNADEGISFGHVVAWPKVMGVFCCATSRENLLKGIETIFNDECWLPRKMLFSYLEQTRSRLHSPAPEAAILTPKEVETLRLLAGGDSNSHIAVKLNVSPHTVKTHIYNVFRKIKVSNRVQAVHWALQHIDGVEQVLR